MSRMILLQYSRPLNDRKGVYFLSWTPSCSSFGKIGMSLFTGLLRVVACVFTTADLTRPWPSGSTCKTRANEQKLRGTFSSRISTISPSTRFRWGFCYLHYYFFLALLLDIPSSIGTKINLHTSFCWNFPGGGNITVDLVVKMWLGVSGSRSPGSPETVVKGLELIIASTNSHMSVRNESSSKQWPYCAIKPERTFLVVLIWRSHTPPMWLATDGLKIQSMFSFSNSTRISSMAWSNSLHAPTKFVPLSLLISLTGPRRLWSAGVLE